MIIEDDPNLRKSLVDLFDLAGYEVDSAEDGLKGFKAIMEGGPSLVICDVNMPELDGFELLGAVNQRMKGQVIPPFLFLTAKVEPGDIRQGLSLGADDYILKPFDQPNLLHTVRMRLDKRKMLMEQTKGDPVQVNTQEYKGFQKLALPNEEGLELVLLDDIVMCEADRAYCNFHLKSGKKVLVSKPMKEFEGILESNGFIRIHKSHIVNINYAKKYIRGKGGQLLMEGGSIVPVAVRKKEELMKRFKG